jgi:hypothetical protein
MDSTPPTQPELTQEAAHTPPDFYIDGAADDPRGLLIPGDPARWPQRADPDAMALFLWHRHAQREIGMDAWNRLRRQGLTVVPLASWARAMEIISGAAPTADALGDVHQLPGERQAEHVPGQVPGGEAGDIAGSRIGAAVAAQRLGADAQQPVAAALRPDGEGADLGGQNEAHGGTPWGWAGQLNGIDLYQTVDISITANRIGDRVELHTRISTTTGHAPDEFAVKLSLGAAQHLGHALIEATAA